MADHPGSEGPQTPEAAHADEIGGTKQLRWRSRRVVLGSIVFVLLALGLYSIAPYLLPVYVKEGPLVQEAGPDRATVVWFLSRPAKVEFRYRDVQFDVSCPVVAGSASPGGDATRCAAMLSNLQAGRSYEYSITQGARTLARHVLRTSKPADQAYSFIVFGDSGSGTRDQYVLASQMSALNPDFLVHTGDLVYSDGRRSNYAERFFKPYAAMIRQVAFWPSLGNHDLSDGNQETGYSQVFSLPRNGPPDRPPGRDYWFDYASARFVVIDSNNREKLADSLSGWVVTTLRDAPARWRFAVLHHPPYNVGKYDSDQGLKEDLVPALEEAGVDIVFSGHNHIYERSYPIRNGQVAPPGRGTVYVVTGAGGRSLYELPAADSRPAWLATLSNKAFSFTLVTIDGPVLTLKQIDIAGEIIDQFALRKESTPVTSQPSSPAPANAAARRQKLGTAPRRRNPMNWDMVKGNWKQWQGSLKRKWSKLTDDDLGMIDGDRMRLTGILQERYGQKKEEAERNIDDFLKTL